MAQFAMPKRRRTNGGIQLDTPVSGVDSVTDIGGGQIRVLYYVNRPSEAGTLERVLLPYAHIMPVSAITDAIGKGMLAIGRKIIAREDGIAVAH